FGLRSPVFGTAESLLASMWTDEIRDEGAETKRREWEKLLEVVYGAQVASNTLWLRHAYLVLVARILAYLAIVGRFPTPGTEVGLVTGELFAPLGLPNLVERDFFAWLGLPQAVRRTQSLVRRLFHHIRAFSLEDVNEDLLKELYEQMVDPPE